MCAERYCDKNGMFVNPEISKEELVKLLVGKTIKDIHFDNYENIYDPNIETIVFEDGTELELTGNADSVGVFQIRTPK
jgi:hypothetical protein